VGSCGRERQLPTTMLIKLRQATKGWEDGDRWVWGGFRAEPGSVQVDRSRASAILISGASHEWRSVRPSAKHVLTPDNSEVDKLGFV
jgi:hypothetical protein